MVEEVLKYSLLSLGIFMMGLFFIVKDPGGDSSDVFWRLELNKTHLAHDWAMPYFTPGRCGGFLLAADAQDPLFSVYMLINFIVPNVQWVLRIGNFLLSLLFGFGVYHWLRYFEIENKIARMFTGFLMVFSGYWISHMVWGGHSIWAHGLAYLPWIMVLLEQILQCPVKTDKAYGRKVFLLTLLFFLLINSGYYWLQVAVPVIGARVITALVVCFKHGFKPLAKLFAIALAFIGGILLSLPRLGGIYEFQLKKFPRQGGEVGAMQVIGNNIQWMTMTFRSFFDPHIIMNQEKNYYLAFPWDYSNYIGVGALILLLMGTTQLNKIWSKSIFISLTWAALFQLAMTRTTHAQDLVRSIFPIYKQVTWYWRGSAIVLLLMAVCIAYGCQWLLTNTKKSVVLLGWALMLVIYTDILLVHLTQTKLQSSLPVDKIFTADHPPPVPLQGQYAACTLGCIFGYGNEHPPQISFQGGSFDKPSDPVFFNAHDVRRLAMKEADGGYYLMHRWPLWPRKDAQEFQKFINYKQVVPLPASLLILNVIGFSCWVIFILLGIILWRLP